MWPAALDRSSAVEESAKSNLGLLRLSAAVGSDAAAKYRDGRARPSETSSQE